MNEEWRPIIWTDGRIEVSSEGRVRSNLRDGRILKTTPDNKGYHRVRFTLDGVKHTIKVHREVAKAFLPNPGNLPQVNHKDGSKDNNRVDNLEWISNYNNAQHAIQNNLWANVYAASSRANAARMTPIYSVDAESGEVRNFSSVSEAERFFNTRHVSDVLKGKRQRAAGQFFYRR